MVNRLADAASPYLRQHLDNPVDWYQWGEEAFAEARRTDKPILLSIGYSACHWCHVMAHESFEDIDVAAVMNELFVNIKVDREERPDVDAVYMDAVQALTGRGGWPMTVFCTPAGEPFYGGTYYPKETFLRLLDAVDDAWKNRRDELSQNVDALVEAIGRTSLVTPAESIDVPEMHRLVVKELVGRFDSQWGGFGSAPKFPSTFALDLMLRFHLLSSNDDALRVAITSLDAMAAGGMYDHLGGGFARYSVDGQWLVPHFEKMLYDQALLLRVYLHAWQVTGDDRHRQVATETIEYVRRELTSPDGGFYSSQDADSLDEHGHSEEGAFYTFSVDEVRSILGDDADIALEWWGMTNEGNFEGRNIPHRTSHRGELARPPEVEAARLTLFQARSLRHHPGRDDKVLLEWNAMMLSSICEAAAAFDDSSLISMAVNNANFLERELRDGQGRWRRSWLETASPRLQHDALAHDLAHVTDAFTRMYELTGVHKYLTIALDAAHQLIDEHWDEAHGGLFTVSSRSEQLIVRQKDLMDNATPSSHSVAALAFIRLAALTGEDELRERAVEILRLLARVLPSAPSAFCHAMSAMELLQEGTIEVVIPGENPEMIRLARESWRPRMVLAFGEPVSSPLWQDRHEGLAYVCEGHQCLLPAATAEELRDRLITTSRGG